MKKIYSGIFIVVFLFSCGNKNKNTVPAEPVVEVTDTLTFTQDTVTVVELPPVEEIPPVRANESFDDFIFNFISDSRLQMNRIIFPLSVYKNDTVEKINKDEWAMDSIFYNQTYYTVLFDREEDIDKVTEDSRLSIQVEEIFMQPLEIRKYYFEKIDGRWMLEGINEKKIEENRNREFIEFFYKFANDSVFQQEHTRDPLKFITVDPDDDFGVIESTLGYNQWLAFKPILPKERLSNIAYGQINNPRSSHRIIQLKGIGNGFLNTLYFRRKNNQWELYKFEDTSN